MNLKLGILIAAPLFLLGVLLSTGVVIVNVREGGPDGQRIVVPVPMLLARTASAIVPADQLSCGDHEVGHYLPLAENAVAELISLPEDVLLVSVNEPGEQVEITKRAGRLEIAVDGSGEKVHLSLPLAGVAEVLRSFDAGSVELDDLLRAVASAEGELLNVRDGETEVTISVW